MNPLAILLLMMMAKGQGASAAPVPTGTNPATWSPTKKRIGAVHVLVQFPAPRSKPNDLAYAIADRIKSHPPKGFPRVVGTRVANATSRDCMLDVTAEFSHGRMGPLKPAVVEKLEASLQSVLKGLRVRYARRES